MTDIPEHVDFLRVTSTTRISVEVPVEFLNEDESPGLKTGGVLNVVRYNVEVSCTPDLIPTSLVLDLAGTEIGDSLHISAVNLPEGVTPTITDRDFTIATIPPSTVVKEEETVSDEEADTEVTEGESVSAEGEEEAEEGDDN